MLYLWVKFAHIVSSTILFGTGIGTACTFLFGHFTRNTQVIAATTRYVVLADWAFTGSSGFIQPITGLWLVYLGGYSWRAPWIVGSMIGYLVAAACWFPVVFLQIKMRDFACCALQNNTPLPPLYFRYFKYWFILGWPAFIGLFVVFYLMTNKPSGLF